MVQLLLVYLGNKFIIGLTKDEWKVVECEPISYKLESGNEEPSSKKSKTKESKSGKLKNFCKTNTFLSA